MMMMVILKAASRRWSTKQPHGAVLVADAD
jgi:hypothetical protein